MNVEEIKELVAEKISNFEAMHSIMKDDYGKGAIEALEGLLHEIKEQD